MIYSMFVWMAGDMSFGDRASTAGIVTLQGMLTIFAVLALLWGAIELMHRVLAGKSGKKPASDKKTASADSMAASVSVPNTDDAAVAAAIAATLAASEDEGALVAAITAAISAKLADEGYTGSFRVVSFKRSATASRRRK